MRLAGGGVYWHAPVYHGAWYGAGAVAGAAAVGAAVGAAAAYPYYGYGSRRRPAAIILTRRATRTARTDVGNVGSLVINGRYS